MKRFVCILAVLVMLVSLATPVFATEEDHFVPSITYKPTPEFVPVVDEDGEEHIGVLEDEEGNVVDYIDHGCILVTPIAHVWDPEIAVPQDVERLLLFVYDGLSKETMTIPYEKHEANLDPASMVIRDLFDVRWACDEHPNILDQEGVTLDIIFDLGVVADAEIFVMSYDEAKDEWSPIVKTVNNGDGTVTCTFDHFCALEFSMVMASAPVAEQPAAEKAPFAWGWLIAFLVAAAAAVVVLVSKKKETANK